MGYGMVVVLAARARVAVDDGSYPTLILAPSTTLLVA